MDIIIDFLNIPQEDALSSSSRSVDGTLIINVTLVSKQSICPTCGFSTSHIKDYKRSNLFISELNYSFLEIP